jgi:hypothetical protein
MIKIGERQRSAMDEKMMSKTLFHKGSLKMARSRTVRRSM